MKPLIDVHLITTMLPRCRKNKNKNTKSCIIHFEWLSDGQQFLWTESGSFSMAFSNCGLCTLQMLPGLSMNISQSPFPSLFFCLQPYTSQHPFSVCIYFHRMLKLKPHYLPWAEQLSYSFHPMGNVDKVYIR